MEIVSLANCLKGHVYELRSRNLALGVFDGRDGFIGVRTKFDSRYLFTEYHWETGPPHGTASPLRDLGPVPDGVELKERLGSVDQRNGRPVAFDRPVAQGGRGWYYTDTGEADQEIRALALLNKPLFDYLDALEPDTAAGESALSEGLLRR